MAYEANGKNAGPGRDDDKKVFIGGLGRNITENNIREYFGKYGEIVNIDLKSDPFTGQSRGFGFVQFSTADTVDNVLAENEHTIGNKKIDVKKVTKKVNPLKCRIFVGGLTNEITETDIKNYFSQYGSIIDFQHPFDKAKNQRKGFCFITFDDTEVVKQVLASPKQVINGKEVDVKKVKFNPETMGGPGGRPIRGANVNNPAAYNSRAYAAYSNPTAYPGYGYPTNPYEAYGPAYGGYDYSTLGYGEPNYGVQAYGGGKYRDNVYQRPAPY